jgi:hypothetical protein
LISLCCGELESRNSPKTMLESFECKIACNMPDSTAGKALTLEAPLGILPSGKEWLATREHRSTGRLFRIWARHDIAKATHLCRGGHVDPDIPQEHEDILRHTRGDEEQSTHRHQPPPGASTQTANTSGRW